MLRQHKIDVIPLTFPVPGRIYQYGVDIISYRVYELFYKSSDFITGASSSQGAFRNIPHRAARKHKNCQRIIVTSWISTEFSVINLAIERLKVELTGARIELFDY
jgi:fatty acid-binding protein DegV